jgi:predicted ester cyclase
VEEFWGKGDLSLAELYQPDMVDHAPLPGQAPGRQGMIDQCAMFHDAFDIEIKVEALFGEGDLVCDRWSAVLTHKGELLGVAPSGRSATVHAIDVMRLSDGLVAEAWHQEDMHLALREFGIAP